MFKNIGIIAKQNNKKVGECLHVLVKFLLTRQINILMDSVNATNFELNNVVTVIEKLEHYCALT
ncbi:hypothetical protein QUF50_10955, partial [Thiotrichales bacterium HSG1]|nr:hypothetical protein [Thiotrichales bacterium HSG1]